MRDNTQQNEHFYADKMDEALHHRKEWNPPKLERLSFQSINTAANTNAYEVTGGVWQQGS